MSEFLLGDIDYKNLELDIENEDAISVEDIIKRIAENNSSITIVDLRYKNLSTKKLSSVFSSIKSNSHVQELKLDGNQHLGGHIKLLADALSVNSSIKKLHVRFTCIGDDGAQILLNCLKQRKTRLTELLISLGNKISPSLEALLETMVSPTETPQISSKKPTVKHTELHSHSKHKRVLDKKHSRKKSSSIPLSTAFSEEGVEGLTDDILKSKYHNDVDTLSLITSMRDEILDLRSKLSETQLSMNSSNDPNKFKKPGSIIAIDINRAQINEKLAETGGSSASVFGCLVDGWQCAMKELDLQGVSENALKGFETEINVLEALPHHPNIIRYLFHQKKGNKLRLYMTRYAASLGKLILQRESDVRTNKAEHFTPSEITKWCIDLATGLEYLKNCNIIHRDLKSDNIFATLDTHGEVRRLIIGDFDTAKRINKAQNVVAKTIIGTPGYMAPIVFWTLMFNTLN